jgi:hypothetical protein
LRLCLLLTSLLGTSAIVGCEGETKTVTAATQLLVSVDFVEGLRTSADSLRASVYIRSANVWERGSSVTLSTAGLRWPVDLPLLPSKSEHESADIEIVLEALKDRQVLAETRLLSHFVHNEHRTLRALLAVCRGEVGLVCSPAGCHGDACSICGPSGACVPVVLTVAEPTLTLDAGALDTGGQPPNDASTATDAREAGNDAGGSSTPSSDAGASVTPSDDAGSAPTPDAATAVLPDAGGAQVPVDAGAVDAGRTPQVCPTDHGCLTPYPCVPTDLGYTCLGQSADWPMPDGFDSSKYKQSYSSDGITVIDNVTKLEWETNVNSVMSGCTKQIEYREGGSSEIKREPVGSYCSLVEARKHCDDLKVGDKDDWRLPSVVELVSLLDHARIDYRIGINADFFPDIEWSNYVTTSLYPGAPASYREVDFVQRSTWKGELGKVRCVRGLPNPPFAKPADRYSVDVTTDTVTDKATHLVWQRSPSSKTFPSADPGIAAYCTGGFRLPSSNELFSLVDTTRLMPAIDTTAFPGTPSAKFWALNNDRGSAVSFQTGDLGYAEGDGYVRCVR